VRRQLLNACIIKVCVHMYSTSGGLHAGNDGVSYTAPATMWVKAFDLMFSRLEEKGFPFGRVVSISGCGQVYNIYKHACAHTHTHVHIQYNIDFYVYI